MAEIGVPTNDCLGVDVAIGGVTVASYNADKHGVVNIENRYVADQVRKQVGASSGRVYNIPQGQPTTNCNNCADEILSLFGPTCWKCRNGN